MTSGVVALYYGIKPALLRQATYGTIKIGLYHTMKRMVCGDQAESLGKNMLAGMAAGAISSAICNPTDVLKVRLQAQTLASSGQTGMMSAFVDMFKTEGLGSIYSSIMDYPNILLYLEYIRYIAIRLKYLRTSKVVF